MIYPTINQYIETLLFENSCFRTLENIELLKNSDYEPIYSAGGCSVVFKVIWHGELYAMKLYTSFLVSRNEYFDEISGYFELNPSLLIPWFKYYAEEISVYIGDGKFGVFPVLMLKWVDGELLSTSIQKLCNLCNIDKLIVLTNSMLSFMLELSSKEYTHVDLKCDNIMINGSGDIMLIDIDAMFIPPMDGCYSVEKGTVWYQHPLRSEAKSSRFLSDYPTVVIIGSMIILEKEPILLEKYSNGENLLFNPCEIYCNESKIYNYLINKYSDNHVISVILDLLKSKSLKIMGLNRVLKMISYIRDGCYKKVDISFFDDYTPYYEGIAAVKFCDKWRFVDSNRDKLTELFFDECKCFSEGYAAVRIGETWCLLDKNMNKQFCFDCQEMGIVRQGLVAVKKNGFWGYCNIYGENVIDHIYELARPFTPSGEAIVKYNGVETKIKFNYSFLKHR